MNNFDNWSSCTFCHLALFPSINIHWLISKHRSLHTPLTHTVEYVYRFTMPFQKPGQMCFRKSIQILEIQLCSCGGLVPMTQPHFAPISSEEAPSFFVSWMRQRSSLVPHSSGRFSSYVALSDFGNFGIVNQGPWTQIESRFFLSTTLEFYPKSWDPGLRNPHSGSQRCKHHTWRAPNAWIECCEET